MKSFVRELSDKEVLSAGDILKLKNYIAEKYKYSSSSEKAQILANAVHRVLDNNLPEIEVDYRASIRQRLMEKTVKSENHTISMYDVFDSCLSLEVKSKDFVNGLVNWINLNVDNKITDNEIHQYSNNEIHNLKLESISLNNSANNDEVAAQVIQRHKIDKISKLISFKYAVCFISFIAILVINYLLFNIPYSKNNAISNIKKNPFTCVYLKNNNGYRSNKSEPIPASFKFKNVNRRGLKKYLLTKKSLLGIEPYFSTIISVAKEYNINPLVLFAIAGQEQGFAPQLHATSRSIANNPFNVYHSWKEYNTNISDATKIVCATILNLSKNRPSNVEPFVWINRKYAQDQNWAHGVNLIYNKLEKINHEVN